MKTRFAAVASAVAAAAWVVAAPPAQAAGDPPVPEGVVRLSTSASTEVTKDLLSITFNTSREGVDAAGVQSQLKQALDAALGEAKKAVRPGELEVRTGNFSLSPRYVKGVVSGWQGSAELTVFGRDMRAIGELSGRITTLTIGRVGYDLSREARERFEGEVAARAIAAYRTKAADYAKQFGYTGFALREIDVATNEQAGLVQDSGMRMRVMAAAAPAEPLPVEPGKGIVNVTVSGAVQLTR